MAERREVVGGFCASWMIFMNLKALKRVLLELVEASGQLEFSGRGCGKVSPQMQLMKRGNGKRATGSESSWKQKTEMDRCGELVRKKFMRKEECREAACLGEVAE